MERLKGKTARGVGAGSIGPGWGNGKATAVTFARHGAQVFCVDRNGNAAEFTAPQLTTNDPALISTTSPSRSISAETTRLPDESVIRRRAYAFVQRSTFGLSSAGRTPRVSASLFASSLQGNASQVPQRIQRRPPAQACRGPAA